MPRTLYYLSFSKQKGVRSLVGKHVFEVRLYKVDYFYHLKLPIGDVVMSLENCVNTCTVLLYTVIEC